MSLIKIVSGRWCRPKHIVILVVVTVRGGSGSGNDDGGDGGARDGVAGSLRYDRAFGLQTDAWSISLHGVQA